jgi:hypothetical protein
MSTLPQWDIVYSGSLLMYFFHRVNGYATGKVLMYRFLFLQVIITKPLSYRIRKPTTLYTMYIEKLFSKQINNERIEVVSK